VGLFRHTLAGLFLCLPLFASAQSSPKNLAHDLKGKIVFLRQMYVENDLVFDAQGNPTNTATPGPFSISAIQIEKTHVGGSTLELEGVRCLILNPSGNDDPASLSQIRFLPTGETNVVINGDAAHPEALQSTAHKIFAFSLDEALAGKTPSQRKYALFTLAALTRPVGHMRTIPREDSSDRSSDTDTEPMMHPGQGVSIPRAIHQSNPEYTDEARKKKINGTCILDFIIDKQGIPIHIRIQQPLDPGLDEKAIITASQYRFSPAMLNDNPVPVQFAVEVNFRLY
jgi:TonB family protein